MLLYLMVTIEYLYDQKDVILANQNVMITKSIRVRNQSNMLIIFIELESSDNVQFPDYHADSICTRCWYNMVDFLWK